MATSRDSPTIPHHSVSLSLSFFNIEEENRDTSMEEQVTEQLNITQNTRNSGKKIMTSNEQYPPLQMHIPRTILYPRIHSNKEKRTTTMEDQSRDKLLMPPPSKKPRHGSSSLEPKEPSRIFSKPHQSSSSSEPKEPSRISSKTGDMTQKQILPTKKRLIPGIYEDDQKEGKILFSFHPKTQKGKTSVSTLFNEIKRTMDKQTGASLSTDEQKEWVKIPGRRILMEFSVESEDQWLQLEVIKGKKAKMEVKVMGARSDKEHDVMAGALNFVKERGD